MQKSKITLCIVTLALIGLGFKTDLNKPASISLETLVKLSEGKTNIFGGGNYISIQFYETSILIIYGTENIKNYVNILCLTKRHCGIVEISEKSDTSSRVLEYYTILGYRLEQITMKNLSSNISLMSSWKIQNLKENKSHNSYIISIELLENIKNLVPIRIFVKVNIWDNKTIIPLPIYKVYNKENIEKITTKNYSAHTIHFSIETGIYIEHPEEIRLYGVAFTGYSAPSELVSLIEKKLGSFNIKLINNSEAIVSGIGENESIGRIEWHARNDILNLTNVQLKIKNLLYNSTMLNFISLLPPLLAPAICMTSFHARIEFQPQYESFSVIFIVAFIIVSVASITYVTYFLSKKLY